MPSLIRRAGTMLRVAGLSFVRHPGTGHCCEHAGNGCEYPDRAVIPTKLNHSFQFRTLRHANRARKLFWQW